MNNICRICETTSNPVINLTTPTNQIIVKKLLKIADVLFSNDDHLPKFICSKCKESIDQSFEFKQQCEQTDRKLRSSLKLIYKACESISSLPPPSTIKHDIEFLNLDLQKTDPTDPIVAEEDAITTIIKIEHIKNDLKDELGFEDNVEVKVEIEEKDGTLDWNDPINTSPELLIPKKKTQTIKTKPINKRSNAYRLPADVSYECYICKNPYKILKSLRDHIYYKHSKDKITFECFICKKAFGHRKAMRGHMDTHRYVECSICGKNLQKLNLNRHISEVHLGIKLFHCPNCDKSFAQKIALDKHMFGFHSGPFQCKQCPFQGATLSRLLAHNRQHMDPTQCRTQFRRQKNVVYTCEYCGRQSTGYYGNHLAHLRTHTGEKPFKCDICQRGFALKTTLRIHSYIHSGLKPYTCEMCGKTFRQPTHFKKHQLAHAGVKRYQCTFCDKSYTTTTCLKSHINTHTGETPYHCALCPAKFINAACLKRHQKVHLK